MSRSTTHRLAAAVIVLAASAVFAAWRADAARTAAFRAENDLASVRSDLADMAAWHVTASTGVNTDVASDLNRRIRAAASAAGLVDHLVSVEPGSTARVQGTDLARTPIYLRAENVTLRELLTFLTGFTRADAAVRVTGIDLSGPPGTDAARPETWSADVTLSESAVAPAKKDD